MRSRTPLALMEQAVMLLVFVFAAVLCVRAFVNADQTSGKSMQKDSALLAAKNMVERLKAEDPVEEDFTICYDENWEETADEDVYELSVIYIESGSPYLWKAEATVTDRKGAVLASLPAAGQRRAGEEP